LIGGKGVVGVLLLPVFLSDLLVELVIGIGGHLGALPEALSRPLALAPFAVTPIFETRI
jgi:hypothetical protein